MIILVSEAGLTCQSIGGCPRCSVANLARRSTARRTGRSSQPARGPAETRGLTIGG